MAAVADDIERALGAAGVDATIANRLPWGLIVQATPAFARMVHSRFPRLEIAEESRLTLA